MPRKTQAGSSVKLAMPGAGQEMTQRKKRHRLYFSPIQARCQMPRRTQPRSRCAFMMADAAPKATGPFGTANIRAPEPTWRRKPWSKSRTVAGSGRPIPVFTVPPRRPALFFCELAPYIEDAGSPAMEINDRRNKPFGPGGSTRRLHQSPPKGRFRRGRTRIDEGVKGEFFLGMVPPLSGYAIVANDNYAPVAQAA